MKKYNHGDIILERDGENLILDNLPLCSRASHICKKCSSYMYGTPRQTSILWECHKCNNTFNETIQIKD